MNALQAIQDAPKSTTHSVTVICRRAIAADLLAQSSPYEHFEIHDTGIGFDDDNFDSFNTAYSEHKLKRGGKGLGRFMWLKAFDKAEISSTFQDLDDRELWSRSFTFDLNYNPDHVVIERQSIGRTGTLVKLVGLKGQFRSEYPADLETLAQRIVEHFILVFNSDDCPSIKIQDESHHISLNDYFAENFEKTSKQSTFTVEGMEFTIRGFRLRAPRVSRHRLLYAANARSVTSDKLDQYIPNLSTRLSDPDGKTFVYLAIVAGEYLNQKVNNFRTDLDIVDESVEEDEQFSIFRPEVTRSKIRRECLPIIETDLADAITSINESKTKRIAEYVADEAPQYRPLIKHLPSFIDRIAPNAGKIDIELALHKELHLREVELKKEGPKIFLEAAKLDNYEDYQARLASFMDKHNEVGVAALAQHVTHRKIILDLFDNAISFDQKNDDYPLEKAVHNIIFPMRSTNEDVLYSQQNLWMLDERLTFHSFIASDKPLNSHTSFECDSSKRPDLFIWRLYTSRTT